MAVAWHFLYEGVAKLFSDGWSASEYLKGATGFLSGFYHWLASSEAVLQTVDLLNIAGLIAIGLALFLGLLVRPAALAGAFLMALYYFAYPPFGPSLMLGPEGSLFLVNKTLIEGTVLAAFVFLSDTGYGIDRLADVWRVQRKKGAPLPETARGNTRREVLRNLAGFPLLGLMGWGAWETRRHYSTDAVSGATVQVGGLDITQLKGQVPKGRIGRHEISRLVMGGNLIGGWTHARDLRYVSPLVKAYHTEKRIFETLSLAEETGINAINIGFPSNPVLQKYKQLTGSRIQVISQVSPDMNRKCGWFDRIDEAIDCGADILQVQGNSCDWLVRDGRLDVIAKMLDRIRSQGYVAGLGAHCVDALIACELAGIIPDYYMKTLHHDRYWSAHPRENRVAFEVDGPKHADHDKFHDNLFCLFPERSVEFVRRTTVPVMGYKVLAAGAIRPEDGFRWAFENGADFICVGMFDFQLVEDVNIALDVLNSLEKRERAWYA